MAGVEGWFIHSPILCWKGFLDTLVLLNKEARVISAEVR